MRQVDPEGGYDSKPFFSIVLAAYNQVKPLQGHESDRSDTNFVLDPLYARNKSQLLLNSQWWSGSACEGKGKTRTQRRTSFPPQPPYVVHRMLWGLTSPPVLRWLRLRQAWLYMTKNCSNVCPVKQEHGSIGKFVGMMGCMLAWQVSM